MLMLLLLGLILNNGSEITDVGKIKIYLKPLRELSECFFLWNFDPTFEMSLCVLIDY